MSWSIAIPEFTVEQVDDIPYQAAEEWKQANTAQNAFAETGAQIDAAINALRELVASRAAGMGTFSGSISGHANVNHENPTEGWANEIIRINLYNRSK